MHVNPLVARRRLTRADLAHIAFVDDVFLPELAARGVLDPSRAAPAREVLLEFEAEVDEPVPADPIAVSRLAPAPPPATGWMAPEQAAPPAVPHGPADVEVGLPVTELPSPEPPSPEPPRLGPAWPRTVPDVATSPGLEPPAAEPPIVHAEPPMRPWERAWDAIRSDLAVHGVAYLGVLLSFVGAFGLVAFAFGDIRPEFRPVAEIAIALVPFGAAALLLSRGAVIVGRALEVAGGLLLPVMATTSLLDGVAVPPDLVGPALVVALTSISLALAFGYRWWSSRHPDSALRYLVAPMLWLAAAMAALGVGRPIPSGDAVAIPGSGQVAVTMAALVATVLWARRSPHAALAGPSCVAAVPGLAILGMLAILTWVREADAPALAVASAGLLGMVALDLLASPEPPANRVGPRAVGVLAPAWWSVTVLGLASTVSPELAAGAGALGFLLLLERTGMAGRPDWALMLPAAGAVALPWYALERPEVTVVVLAVQSAWALLRRTSPYPVAGAAGALDAAAVILPVLCLGTLAQAESIEVGLIAAGVLVLLSGAVAGRTGSTFGATAWTAWIALASAASLVAGLASLLAEGTAAPISWLYVIAAVLLSASAATGPMKPDQRAWVTLTLLAWTWTLTCDAADLDDLVRGGAVAAVALGLVASALVARPSIDRAAARGLAGHALAVLSLALGGLGWGLAATTVLFTVGWFVTALADAWGRAPAGAMALGGQLPGTLAAVGLPASTLAVLHAANPQTWTADAAGTLAVVAVAMALVVRVLPTALRTPFAGTSFATALVGVAAAGDRQTLILTLGALIVGVLLVPGKHRWPVLTWSAWAAVAPLCGLVAAEWWGTFNARPDGWQAAATLCAVGSLMLLGAAAADLPGKPLTPHWRPRRRALEPVALLGVAQTAVGLAILAGHLDAGDTSAVLFGVAGCLLATAALTQVGALAGVAAFLAWGATQVLIEVRSPDGRAWFESVGVAVSVAAAVLLLGLTGLAHRLHGDAPAWVRWDLSLGIASAAIAAHALSVAAGTSDEPWTNAAIGALTLLVAARLRRMPTAALALTALGAYLILAGAHSAGPWWLAGALGALSVGLTVAAALTPAPARIALQLSGAGTAVLAWAATVSAADWSTAAAVDLTAAGAGAVGLGAALAARRGPAARSWVLVWGGTATAVVAVAAASCWAGAEGLAPTAPLTAGMAVTTAAILLAAGPLGIGWLWDLGAVGVLTTLLTAIEVAPTLLESLDGTTTVRVLALVGVSAVCATGTWLTRAGPQRAMIEVGVASTVLALILALPLEPPRWLAVASLAAGSLQSASVGSALRLVSVQMLAPLFAWAAWLVVARDALDDRVDWVTVPTGLALLGIVGIWRHDRAARSEPKSSPEIVTMEAAGMAMLVGASLVQMVTESLLHSIPALALGIGLAAWGVITRVRRRLVFGASVVGVALILLVAGPIADLVPSWPDAGLWILLIAVGMTALLVASFIERGRAAARSAVMRFGELTQGWE